MIHVMQILFLPESWDMTNIFMFSDPKEIDYTFINIEFWFNRKSSLMLLKRFLKITLHKLFIETVSYSILWSIWIESEVQGK